MLRRVDGEGEQLDGHLLGLVHLLHNACEGELAQAAMAPATIIIRCGPRDEHEVEIRFEFILAAYFYAGG